MIINIALAVLAIIVAYLFNEHLATKGALDYHWHLIKSLMKENKRLNEQISRISK
jgi:hypothetical protein